MTDTPAAPDKPASKDLTKSIHDDGSNQDPVYNKTRRLVMGVGTMFFGLTALGVFAPMIYGVSVGIQSDQIWDPYTGRAITSDKEMVGCIDEAQRLLIDSGRHQMLNKIWSAPYESWSARCALDHKELAQVLSRTEAQLKKKTPLRTQGLDGIGNVKDP